MKIIQSIGGVAPPLEPLTYQITKADLYSESTGRSSETGVMLSYPIRFNVYTLSLEYLGDGAVIKQLESMMSGSQFAVTFLEGGEYLTKTMYASDRTKTIEKVRGDSERTRLSFQLIEI